MKLIYKITIYLLKFVIYSFITFNLIIVIVPILFTPQCNSSNLMDKFDVIIVLGSPATQDCKPHEIMKSRVDKAIVLYNKGVSKKIIFTGSIVHNSCSESEVMANYAINNGVKRADVIIENQAKNTYQNAYYSINIMNNEHFKTAAVVTSKPHIKRSCMIFSTFNINYTMIAANYPKNNSNRYKLFWNLGERMILTHHIIFGIPK